MKKILMGLMITGVIFGERDHSFYLNGNLALGIRYTDINNNVSSYPKDFSYTMELSTVGKLDKNDLGGILNFGYDRLNKADIENVYISLDYPYCKLEGGDVILDISDFVISNATIRGIKGDISNKDALFAFGVSKEKISVGSTTSGQYRQFLGLIRKEGVLRNNTLGITYLKAEDDPSSSNISVNPIKNSILEGDIIIPLAAKVSFKSLIAFSEYNDDKRDKAGIEKDKAFEGGFDLNFSNLSFEGIYSYIGGNFSTAGNSGLDNDYKGIKLNLKHTPQDRPITTELEIERYNDNLDKSKANTTKTEIYKINEEITPTSFPSLSIEYKRTNEKDSEVSPSKIGNEVSFGISPRIKDIDISADYSISSFDNKKQDEYDSSISSYALNTSGALTKKISLSSSLSFITSKMGKGAQETKEDSNYYLLSLSFQPTPSLRLTSSYDYSKTKDKEKDKESVILDGKTISFTLDYYLSPKYQINMEYENVENKETDNNYKGDSFGVKIIGLF